LLALLASSLQAASPTAGTRIANQAVATYLDGAGLPQTVVSNLVEVLISQVPAVSIQPDVSLTGQPGQIITFPHTVTNQGNGTDAFDLLLTQSGGDDYNLLDLQIFPDVDANGRPDDTNANGQPDASEAITRTPPLPPGGIFPVVIQGRLPPTVVKPQLAKIQITARSQHDLSVQDGPRTDTVLTSDQAVVTVTKTLSPSFGRSPSGQAPGPGHVVRLTYTNFSPSSTAHAVTLVDPLPTGLRYRPGTARWSISGSSHVLTEVGDGFEAGNGLYRLDFQEAGNVVTAVIDELRPGLTGFLEFQVEVPSGLAPSVLLNTANYRFDDGAGGGLPNQGPTPTNTTPFRILNSAAVTIQATNSPIASAPEGSTVIFHNLVTNPAAGNDSFDITLHPDALSPFPGGTIFTLYKNDGATLLLDTNGNGIPDTGPLDGTTGPGSNTYDVILKAQLPLGAAGPGPFKMVKMATSTLDPGVTDTTLDELGDIPRTTNLCDIKLTQHDISDPNPTVLDTVTFTMTWANQGTAAAQNTALAGGQPLVVDGVPATFVLLRAGITNSQINGIIAPASGTLLYHRSMDALGTYLTVAPANLSELDHLALGLPVFPAGDSATLSFSVKINPDAPQISSTAAADLQDCHTSNPTTLHFPTRRFNTGDIPPTIEYFFDNTWQVTIDHTPFQRPLYVQAKAPTLNLDPFTVETATITLVSNSTGDREAFTGTETGPNTGIFRILNGGSFVPTNNAVLRPKTLGDGILDAISNELLTATIEAPVAGVTVSVNTVILIDPAGVVFDSRTGLPVPGATVSLIDVTGAGNGGNPGGPATVFDEFGVPAPSVVVTGASGLYEYPLVPASTYQLQIAPPPGFTFPSLLAPAQLPPGFRINASGSYGGNFTVSLATGAVFIDVPMDTATGTGLLIQKTASRDVIELGESLDYEITLRNTSPLAMSNTLLTDLLPRGFRYQKGSSRLASGTPLADPAGGAGSRLTFNVGLVPPNTSFVIRYRLQVGAGATAGDLYNTAQATATQAGVTVASNVARAKVRVRMGVFTDRGVLFGRVFVDSDRDDIADAGEPGIPGVRVFLEDGTFAVTDLEGKYSLHGISSRTHVARVDPTTLPPGAYLTRLRNRHGDRTWSRFADMRGGELYKANFAIDPGCERILVNIETRRRKGEIFAAELDRGLRANFLPQGPVVAGGDLRSRPSEGFLGQRQRAARPQFDLPQTVRPPTVAEVAVGASSEKRLPVSSLSPPLSEEPDFPKKESAIPLTKDGKIDYATLAEGLSSALGFVNLRDGQILETSQPRIQIKGHAQATLQLTINGESVPSDHLGGRVLNKPNQVQFLEYVGLKLQTGSNLLKLNQLDSFGNSRGSVEVQILVPGPLAHIELEASHQDLPADGQTPVTLQVRLLDASGTPVPARTRLTLENDAGRFEFPDPNPEMPGHQVFITGGSATFRLLPPSRPGVGHVRIGNGLLSDEAELRFVPPLRPMILVGIVEGKIYRRKLNLATGAVEPTRQGDPFEKEFVDFFGKGAGTQTRAGARTAFFLKGKVRGQRLLTVAYDSEKEENQRLFRDIQPEEFYPIYGDGSLRGYDAQSTSKLYVRLDKGPSYTLYGDFNTRLHQGSEIQLGSYSRSLTGLNHHTESPRGQVTVFASKGSQRQVVDEIPTNGTSGPYLLSNQLIEVNSEKVEILLRDRNQPAVILKTLPQARFRDYALEPFTGRLIFKAPLRSLDENLNPFSIRVTYERENGGKQFLRGGLFAQRNLSRKVTAGVGYVKEDDPLSRKELLSAHAGIQIAKGTRLVVEAARSKDLANGRGDARRFELHHERGKLQFQARAGRTDSNFINPNASLSAGRDELHAQALYTLNSSTRIKLESLRTGDQFSGAHRLGHFLGIEKSFRSGTSVEFGLRQVKETQALSQPSAAGGGPSNFTSARLRVGRSLKGRRKANVYGEYEQDLSDTDKRLFALGGDVQIHEQTRLYARHELISSLGGRFALNSTQSQNSTVIGLESKYMKSGKIFSEYRGRDAFSGRQTEAAIGLRNNWHLQEGLRLQTTFEKVTALSGVGTQENMATSVGLEFTRRKNLKATTRFEFRNGSTQDSFLYNLGLAYKLDRNWSSLGRYILNRTETPGQADRVLARLQLGVAYRPVHDDRFNGLLRFENRVDDNPAGNAGGHLRDSDILSMHLNYNPNRRWVVTSRYAARWTDETQDAIRSRTRARLIGGRVVYEIAPRWDLGVLASRLFSDGAAAQRSWGLELGRTVGRDFWLGLGYNFTGFSDPELTGEGYTERGLFFRIRAKFDENSFRRSVREPKLPEDCGVTPCPDLRVATSALEEGIAKPEFDTPEMSELDSAVQAAMATPPLGLPTPEGVPHFAVGRDPQIRIMAPAGTRQVVAIFPWGETGRLVKDPASGYWSARFVVPAETPHGAHEVVLVLTGSQGQKRRLGYVFEADRKAPSGVARTSATRTKLGWTVRVSVTASSDTARAQAVLPGGRYLDLTQDPESGRWNSSFDLPNRSSSTLMVPVTLFDEGHNLVILEVEVKLP
jgi:uncharacterized repeat protein (TIGR01451 family)